MRTSFPGRRHRTFHTGKRVCVWNVTVHLQPVLITSTENREQWTISQKAHKKRPHRLLFLLLRFVLYLDQLFRSFCLERHSRFLVDRRIYSQSFTLSLPSPWFSVRFFTMRLHRPMSLEHRGHGQTSKCACIVVRPVSGASACFMRTAGHR